MFAPNRYLRLLRASVLLVLVLGMVICPALAAVGELHGVEHAAGAAGDGALDHVHSDSGHHGHPGDEADSDHATGAHALLHHAASVSVTLPEAGLQVSMRSMPAPLLPELVRSHHPGECPNHPFRPPIA